MSTCVITEGAGARALELPPAPVPRSARSLKRPPLEARAPGRSSARPLGCLAALDHRLPHAQADLWRDARERLHDERDVRVEVDAELLGAAVDVVAVDRAREGLVLELLLDRRGLEARDHAARPHERAR